MLVCDEGLVLSYYGSAGTGAVAVTGIVGVVGL